MSSATIYGLPTGEACSACGEEILLDGSSDAEVDLSCGCSLTSALA